MVVTHTPMTPIEVYQSVLYAWKCLGHCARSCCNGKIWQQFSPIIHSDPPTPHSIQKRHQQFFSAKPLFFGGCHRQSMYTQHTIQVICKILNTLHAAEKYGHLCAYVEFFTSACTLIHSCVSHVRVAANPANQGEERTGSSSDCPVKYILAHRYKKTNKEYS